MGMRDRIKAYMYVYTSWVYVTVRTIYVYHVLTHYEGKYLADNVDI